MKFRLIILVLLFGVVVAGIAAALPTSGTLYIMSSPTGAKIYINDTFYGTTNGFVQNLPVGNQNLMLTKEGYLPYTTVVDVPSGSMKVLAPITLTKSGNGGIPEGTGTLYIISSPTGAKIYINDTFYGTTNGFVQDLPVGNQNLTLTKTGYQAETLIVDVPAGQLKVLAPITLSASEMPGMEWPTGYGQFESSDNARGIFYNGKLYVWSIWWSSDTYKQMTSKDMYRIQYRTFQNGQLSGPHQLWDGTTYAEPAPVIVQYPNNGPQKMFVFVTGRNGNIYFTRLNGTVWEDGDWLRIADSATGNYITTKEDGWEVAPVYNPETHRIYVYYARDYNDYLHYAYSDDYGNTWHAPGAVVNSPIIKAAPGAVFYKPPGETTDVLLAMKDVNQKIRLCKLDGGTVVSWVVFPTPSSDNIYEYGRPFLTDMGNGYIALMYAAEHGDQAYCANWYIPHIVVINKTTGQWGVPYQATTLPDLGGLEGEYQFHWQPNGVIDPTTNTFWLFYGFELCALYTDTTDNGPWWMFNSIPTPGS